MVANADTVFMSKNIVQIREPGQQSQTHEFSQNLKILFLPFFVFLIAVGVYRLFAVSEPKANRTPSSISEIEPISVPVTLKTMLKISASDYDRQTTARIRQSLENGVIPQLLEKSSPVIQQKIRNGEMKFYSFKVMESIDDDGDEIEISIDGMPYSSFTLSQSEVRISIPIEFGKSKLLSIKATRDAGDGITFGAKLINAEFMLDNILIGGSDRVYLGFIK